MIDLAGMTTQQAIEATESVQREFMMLTHLRHPHLPRIYDSFADHSYGIL